MDKQEISDHQHHGCDKKIRDNILSVHVKECICDGCQMLQARVKFQRHCQVIFVLKKYVLLVQLKLS